MATFGNTTAGASLGDPEGGQYLWMHKFTSPAEGGTISKLSLYCTGSTDGVASAKGVLVLASNLTIVANGITGAYSSIPFVAAWYDFTFATPPSFTANTDYYLCFISNYGINPYGATSGGTRWYDTTGTYASPVNPSGAQAADSYNAAIYATYTAGGGSSAPLTAALSDSLIYN